MKSSTNHLKATVNQVFSLYEKYGDEDYIGEPVSQLEHMSQAAALAEEEGYDDEVVLAAFFHDIGHLCAEEGESESMDGFGNVDHEKLGAEYLLEKGFSERVAALVQGHVLAKRYLTYKYPEYYNKPIKEIKEVTEMLKNKACSRIRIFLISKINNLKEPMTNI